MPSDRARQLETIVSKALDLDGPDRQRHIDAACAGDDALRRDVERLIASDEPTLAGADGLKATLDQSAATTQRDLIGQTVGPYRIRSVLGEGGFGIVYLAEQLEPVRRRVALKVLSPQTLSLARRPDEVLARFEAERQALAIMDHPGIASVFDAGTIEQGTHAGTPYFAMEYVAGDPITDYCDRHRLTASRRRTPRESIPRTPDCPPPHSPIMHVM